MNPETDFSIRPFIGGYDKNFTYLITCSQTKHNILVDAACSLNQIVPFIANPPIALLITHTHSDHISYLNEYITSFPEMKIFGHSKTSAMFNIQNFTIIKHHQNFKLGSLLFKSIYTPSSFFLQYKQIQQKYRTNLSMEGL